MKKSFILILTVLLWLCGLPTRGQVSPQGRYIHFNGLDQRISVPNHAHFNLAVGESYTVSCRIRPENFEKVRTILSKGNFMVPESRYFLSTVASSSVPNLSLNIFNSENRSLSLLNCYSLVPDQWVHLVWVYNAQDKTSKMYVNGDLAGSINNLAIGKVAISNTSDLMIGCTWTDAADPSVDQHWQGDLDELRIWKKALSANDVGADKTAAKPDPDKLVAAWDFEVADNNFVTDISGQGHNGKLIGFGVKVISTKLPTGVGQTNERLTGIRIIPEMTTESVISITVDLNGTTSLKDIKTIKIYYNGSSEKLKLSTAKLFGSESVSGPKMTITGKQAISMGDNYFWLTADISPTAREGNLIKARMLTYKKDNQSNYSLPESDGSRTILLTTSLVCSPGDNGSKHYRIPAIITANDGSLITVTDKRLDSPLDLPANMDLVVKRSTDNGRTWGAPVYLAGENVSIPFSNPALVLNKRNGEIVCLFSGNQGFFLSTASDPIRIYQSISRDNGITWSPPKDLTPQIYGANATNPVTKVWQGAFHAPGNFTQLRNGRLMAVIAVRETIKRDISDFLIYSDDNAKTWKVSLNRACTNGNEGKVVELDNGKLLMSVRSSGNRLFNLSNDLGMTWGTPWVQNSITDPSCNGDMIRYTSISGGYEKNRLLHSIPFSTSRKNVSVLLSYDEGTTWPMRKSIYSGASAYSSLCILPDGTLGIYYEVGEYDVYDMYFARFTLTWLSDGADVWVEKWRHFTGVDDITANIPDDFHAYPNPAHGSVTVDGPFRTTDIIRLFNSNGSEVQRTQPGTSGNSVMLPLEGLAPGIYFIRIGEKSLRIVVE